MDRLLLFQHPLPKKGGLKETFATNNTKVKSRVYKSQDVEEELHRTFDFDTDKLLGVKKEKE